ncbi:hypothetical protein ACJX0J_009322, partial [Zea mays]
SKNTINSILEKILRVANLNEAVVWICLIENFVAVSLGLYFRTYIFIWGAWTHLSIFTASCIAYAASLNMFSFL